jgi:hypothetical protein
MDSADFCNFFYEPPGLKGSETRLPLQKC